MYLSPCREAHCTDGSCYCSREGVDSAIIHSKWLYFVSRIGVTEVYRKRLHCMLLYSHPLREVVRGIFVNFLRLLYCDYYAMDWVYKTNTNHILSGIYQAIYVSNNKGTVVYKHRVDGVEDFEVSSYWQGNPIIMMAIGCHHQMYLTVEGGLYTAGDNGNNQLGLTNCKSLYINEPTRVDIPKSTYGIVIGIGCGQRSSYILTTKGLFMCGLDEAITYNSFRKVEDSELDINDKIIIMSCGTSFVVVATLKGKVYGRGSNHHGQLGIDTRIGGSDYYHKLTYAWQCAKNDKIANISCGYLHTMLLTNRGVVYVCGLNDKGRLGIGSNNYYCDTFTQVKTFFPIRYISSGNENSWMIDKHNGMYLKGVHSNAFQHIRVSENVSTIASGLFNKTFLMTQKSPNVIYFINDKNSQFQPM